MPWIWELDSNPAIKRLDWQLLWTKLRLADGGTGDFVDPSESHRPNPEDKQFDEYPYVYDRVNHVMLGRGRAEKDLGAEEREYRKPHERTRYSFRRTSLREGAIKGLVNRKRIWKQMEVIMGFLAELERSQA